jgi:hypothetical protein
MIYRCHICRLELMLDAEGQQLVLAPLDPTEKPPKRSIS